MEIKQQLKMSQQLVMTPQLQQAIRLLQLSRVELIDEIRKELDANPVLSDDEVDPRARAKTQVGAAESDPATALADGDARIERIEMAERAVDPERRTEEKRAQDIDWEAFLENRAAQAPTPGGRSGFEELPPIEANLTKQTSLVDHLRWQLQLSDFNESERRFAELVLGNLDDKGYLDLKGVERENGERT